MARDSERETTDSKKSDLQRIEADFAANTLKLLAENGSFPHPDLINMLMQVWGSTGITTMPTPTSAENIEADDTTSFLLLLAATGTGVLPEKSIMDELMAAWGQPIATPQPAPVDTDTTHREAIAVVPIIDTSADNLKTKVDVAIAEALGTNGLVGSRKGNDLLGKYGIKAHGNIRAGRHIQHSLEESLATKESLATIAKKLALLHDFPSEVGGGQYKGMPRSELKKTLLTRMLEELPSYETEAWAEQNFRYIFTRVMGGNWHPANYRKKGIDTSLSGNELTKASLQAVLEGEFDIESI